MIKASKKMHLYPDRACCYLRQGLAKRLGVHMDEVLVGNGSNELIEFVSHVFLEKGTNIVMASDAFVVYRLIASVFRVGDESGSLRKTLRTISKRCWMPSHRRLESFTSATRTNPTGTMVAGAAIDHFVEQVPEHVVVVLDEAYIELLPVEKQPDTLQYVKESRKVYVLRTFSKTYGLAGLRVGYAIA